MRGRTGAPSDRLRSALILRRIFGLCCRVRLIIAMSFAAIMRSDFRNNAVSGFDYRKVQTDNCPCRFFRDQTASLDSNRRASIVANSSKLKDRTNNTS